MKEKIIPLDKEHLQQIIQNEIDTYGINCDLNHIDVSNITNMAGIFSYSCFNGDISKWNTSNVTDMNTMFCDARFNGDISNWNTSKVTDMSCMFKDSSFNGNISNWNTSNVINTVFMFDRSLFNGNVSNWNVEKINDMCGMFNENSKNKPWWFIENNELRKKAIDSYKLQKDLHNDLDKKPNFKIKVKI